MESSWIKNSLIMSHLAPIIIDSLLRLHTGTHPCGSGPSKQLRNVRAT